jgi:hypothetical protein
VRKSINIHIHGLISIGLFVLGCFLFKNFSAISTTHVPFKLLALFLLILSLFRLKFLPIKLLEVHKLFFIIPIIILVLSNSYFYLGNIWSAPRNDIGQSTLIAIEELKSGLNPYASKVVDPQKNVDNNMHGYKYGPIMFLSYPLAYISKNALKLTNLILLISVFLLLLSMSSSKLIFSFLFLVPTAFFYEVLFQGVIDIVQVFYLALFLYFINKRKENVAYLSLAASIFSKFSPGLFYLLSFARPKSLKAIMLSFIPVLLILIIVTLWSPEALFLNMIKYTLSKPYNDSSIYSLFPTTFHWPFKLILPLALIELLILRYKGKIESHEEKLKYALFLTLLSIMFYKSIHLNYIIWFAPLMAFYISEFKVK